MKIKGKLILLVVVCVVGLGLISTFLSSYYITKLGNQQAAHTEKTLMEDRQLMLSSMVGNVYKVVETSYLNSRNPEKIAEKYRQRLNNVVDIACCAIEEIYSRQDGLSETDKQKQAMDIIRKMRYDGQEYLWINDMQPRMVMHAIKPEMDGSDLSELADPDGKRLFVEMRDVCKKDGAGFCPIYVA